MNAMKNKIKSQKGASITFALLLFLVCAIISSVVIVAATAAAGRMSEQAEMDERYYAVTAVARQLKKEIDGKEVTLEYTKANPVDAKVTAPDNVGNILTLASTNILTKTEIPIPVNSGLAIQNGDKTVSCMVTGTLTADGTLEFDIKATTTGNNRTYNLKQRFASTLKLSATDSAETKASATVKWRMLDMEKGRPDRNQKAGD